MDRCEPDAVLDGVVSDGCYRCGVGRMTEYDHDWCERRTHEDDRVRSRFWLGYMLGLATVFMLVGMMYV